MQTQHAGEGLNKQCPKGVSPGRICINSVPRECPLEGFV